MLFGMHFPHPIGLAAGLDKNAKAVDMFSNIGFGFAEVGTVTPKGQAGNELPTDCSVFRQMKRLSTGWASIMKAPERWRTGLSTD